MAPPNPAGRSLNSLSWLCLAGAKLLADHVSSLHLALTLQPRTSLTFEFIDVEDKDARRKARSHVIREAKQRQKLETLRFQKNKEGTKRSLAPAVSRTKVLQPVLQETSVVAAKAVNFLPSISTVLEGLIDPFNQFPVKLTSGKDLGLVDHCKLQSYARQICSSTKPPMQTTRRFGQSHFCYQIATIHP